MQLVPKQMAHWLKQAKTNIICMSLVILPPSVTHSAHKVTQPCTFLLRFLSLNTALFSHPAHKHPYEFTEWHHLSPLGFHWIMPFCLLPRDAEMLRSASTPVLCQGILIAEQRYRADSHTFCQGRLYFVNLLSHSQYRFLHLFVIILPDAAFHQLQCDCIHPVVQYYCQIHQRHFVITFSFAVLVLASP